MTTLNHVLTAAAITYERHNDIIALNDLLNFYKRIQNDGHDPQKIDINELCLEELQ